MPDVIAMDLWKLWAYFEQSVIPDKRGIDGRSWPFLEFVRAIGRTVDPQFSGEAAVRRVYDLDVETRRELGEIE